MTFFTLIFSSAVIFSAFTAVRLADGWNLRIKGRLFLFISLFLTWMLPVFIVRHPDTATGPGYAVLVDTLYFVFITVVLISCFIMIRDILWFLVWRAGCFFKKNFPSPFHRGVLKKVNFIFVIATFALSLFALYQGKKVPDVKVVRLESPKITQPVTIAVLSDLHITRFLSEQKLKGIVQKTMEQHPDLIVLPGDIIDDKVRFIQPHLKILSLLKAPLGVYDVAGNHEFYVGYQDTVRALQNTSVTYLFNSGIPLRHDLFIAGVPDSKAVRHIHKNADIQQALKNKKDEFTVLLSHQPKFADTLNATQIDLQISGHTHGGQIFPFQMMAKLANRYLSGLYNVNDFYVYVSRGSGQWGPQMRLLAPSEITIIRVYPSSDNKTGKER